MKVGVTKNGKTSLWFEGNDDRITLNEVLCYQCAEIKGVNHLMVTIPGGLMMSLPLDPEITQEDLCYLCDRIAMVFWGIHGRYGVAGVRVPEGEVEET